ncbi:MAG TPA: hypothetical protein VNU72_13860 [Puia sp.]|jgi:hypothetical protein|nr:hypothetical protein [Puia sp.]
METDENCELLTYEEIKNVVLEWDKMLSHKNKKYIHYRTMRNFVLHFNELESEQEKEQALEILGEYVQCVRHYDFSFEGKESARLALGYLDPLIAYYRAYSGFMPVLKLRDALVLGLVVDGVLYLLHLLTALDHIPITTISLFLYYGFLAVFKIPRGRVYGLFY